MLCKHTYKYVITIFMKSNEFRKAWNMDCSAKWDKPCTQLLNIWCTNTHTHTHHYCSVSSRSRFAPACRKPCWSNACTVQWSLSSQGSMVTCKQCDDDADDTKGEQTIAVHPWQIACILASKPLIHSLRLQQATSRSQDHPGGYLA